MRTIGQNYVIDTPFPRYSFVNGQWVGNGLLDEEEPFMAPTPTMRAWDVPEPSVGQETARLSISRLQELYRQLVEADAAYQHRRIHPLTWESTPPFADPHGVFVEPREAPPAEATARGHMKEAHGNLWDCPEDLILITTNLWVSKNCNAVLGRGCAKELVEHVPNAPQQVGMLNIYNNGVGLVGEWNRKLIYSFPVKPQRRRVLEDKSNIVRHMRSKVEVGKLVPGWMCKAEPELIRMSALTLSSIFNQASFSGKTIALPRPGCDAGELNWEDVKPMLDTIFDDRYTAYTL